MLLGADGKYFFIREPYEVYCGRQISEKYCGKQRLFWLCSFRSFLMMALTDAAESPNWHAICLCVLSLS